jgi:hypothetical protein
MLGHGTALAPAAAPPPARSGASYRGSGSLQPWERTQRGGGGGERPVRRLSLREREQNEVALESAAAGGEGTRQAVAVEVEAAEERLGGDGGAGPRGSLPPR